MYQEKTLYCASCEAEFTYTAEEQEFYASKGFQDPKRCKPCRDAAKQEKRGGRGGFGGGGGYGGGGGRGGFDRGPRELFDATCSGCGIETQVPFRPDGRKPVYCRECFQAARTY